MIQVMDKIIEQIKWKIGQLNFLEKNENYGILDDETNRKVFFHRKGFIEGLEWSLETIKKKGSNGD